MENLFALFLWSRTLIVNIVLFPRGSFICRLRSPTQGKSTEVLELSVTGH